MYYCDILCNGDCSTCASNVGSSPRYGTRPPNHIVQEIPKVIVDPEAMARHTLKSVDNTMEGEDYGTDKPRPKFLERGKPDPSR